MLSDSVPVKEREKKQSFCFMFSQFKLFVLKLSFLFNLLQIWIDMDDVTDFEEQGIVIFFLKDSSNLETVIVANVVNIMSSYFIALF